MSERPDLGDPDELPPPQPEIILQPEHMAGVWANWAQVSHTVHEFTLDFVRMDGTAPLPGKGIVVARVSVSPLFISQLVDVLQEQWRLYAENALPPEVRGDGSSSAEDHEPGV